MTDEFLNLLIARRGHFRFESGHHGELWLDLDQLFLRPAELRPFVQALTTRLKQHSFEAVCGPLSGGAFLAQMIAEALQAEFYFTERLPPRPTGPSPSANYRLAHGLQPLLRGKNVAIVDDVINAGSAVQATLAELRSCGAKPVVVGALAVLGDLGAKSIADQGLPLECLTKLPNGLWTPADCPFCAAGVPLQVGGPAVAVASS